MNEDIDGSGSKVFGYVLAGLGIGLMLVVLPFFLSSGLMAPLWAILVLLLIWLVLFVQAVRWFRSHPFRVIAMPVLAVAIWFAVMSAGEAFLGWTA